METHPVHENVTVYTALGHLAGEMIRIFLESKGVPARLSQESAGLVHGLTIGALGEVEILVPADREAEALDLLERMEAGEFELPAGESAGETDEKSDQAEEEPAP